MALTHGNYSRPCNPPPSLHAAHATHVSARTSTRTPTHAQDVELKCDYRLPKKGPIPAGLTLNTKLMPGPKHMTAGATWDGKVQVGGLEREREGWRVGRDVISDAADAAPNPQDRVIVR
jgi:hypothetical protein